MGVSNLEGQICQANMESNNKLTLGRKSEQVRPKIKRKQLGFREGEEMTER